MQFQQIASNIGEVLGLLGTMAAISDVFLYEPKVPMEGGTDLVDKEIEEGSIKLESIEFTYPTKKDIQILGGVKIEVAKNKTIALVGSSGCGKSTIIQLVERFYDPHNGSVKYGTKDLRDTDPYNYKSFLAIV